LVLPIAAARGVREGANDKADSEKNINEAKPFLAPFPAVPLSGKGECAEVFDTLKWRQVQHFSAKTAFSLPLASRSNTRQTGSMTAQPQQRPMSLEEFERFEEASPIKHEFWNGTLIAMAGGTNNHTIICGKIFAAAERALYRKPCRARTSEQRVRIGSANAEYYPDALIFCPPARLTGKGDRILLNPKVIFEVLSESTAEKDRGEKSLAYRSCPSITDYILVSQDRILVEHLRRVEGGWFLQSFNSLEDSLAFPDLEIALPLSEIYDELELPSALFLVEETNQTFED